MPPKLHVVFATALVAVCPRLSAIVITDVESVFSENFDSLVTSGSSSVLPAGWYSSESGSSANADYAAGTGSGIAGNTYSFGASGSSERALGGLRSGSVIPLFGTLVTNATGGMIDSLSISYFGEQWRIGALGRIDRLDFEFSTDATSLTAGTWTSVDGLDFVAPTTTGVVGALGGNGAGNRVALAATIAGLALNNGASLWIRWLDLDASGSDDGLAVDDFSVVARRPDGSASHAVPDAWPTAVGLGAVLIGAAAIRRRGWVANGAVQGD